MLATVDVHGMPVRLKTMGSISTSEPGQIGLKIVYDNIVRLGISHRCIVDSIIITW
jgi:ribosome recycling factor